MNIRYKELGPNELNTYSTIQFTYSTDSIYELRKIDKGLGGILLVPIQNKYEKDFGSDATHWNMFDLTNWKFFGAFDGETLIGGCAVAMKTPDVNMLENRDDLAVLWDLRVDRNYQKQGIGQKLFDLAIESAAKNRMSEFKVECQNTNFNAVRFYHKQDMELCQINERAYGKDTNEVQLLWYKKLNDIQELQEKVRNSL